MRIAIICFGIFFSVTSFQNAGTIRADVGYSFAAPTGWTRSGDDGVYEFTKASLKVAITVQPHLYPDATTMAADISSTGNINTSTYMKANYSRYGSNGLLVKYDGKLNNVPVSIQSINLFSPYGVGITIVATCTNGVNPAPYFEIIKLIASSVSFYTPRPSTYALQWKKKIVGRQLLYLNTQAGVTGGFYEKRTFNLCSKGNFTVVYEEGHRSGDRFNNINKDNSGTWEVYSLKRQGLLVLKFNNGTVQMKNLSIRKNSNEIDVDGNRYFITNAEGCN